MRYEPNHDEIMDSVFLELQIQVGVGEAARTPMLRRDNLAWLRLELETNLAAPRAIFEGSVLPGRLLYERNVSPSLVVAWTVSPMQRREALPCAPHQDLKHMWDAVIGLRNSPNAAPYLASSEMKSLLGVDRQKRGKLLLVPYIRHGLPRRSLDVVRASGPRRSDAVDGDHHILAHVCCRLPESDEGLVLWRVIPSVQSLHIGKLENDHTIREPMFGL